MAEHSETIQWHVRPMGRVEGPPLGDLLPTCDTAFSEDEVKAAVRTLKRKRASGPDEIPAEIWQAVTDVPEGLTQLTDLCNQCWEEEKLPAGWHTASVAAFHKKCSVEECGKCRSISF